MKIYSSEKAGKLIRSTYDELLGMWNTSFEEHDISGKYGTTHVIECGSKENPPLVLFHGVGDDAALMWVYNAKTLAGHFHIFAVDTIGGPGKSVPGEGYTEEFSDIEWIDGLLNSLGLEKTNIAGVSNGSYLVQLYSIMRPERVIKGIGMAGLPSPDSLKGGPILSMLKVFLPEALFPTDKNIKKLISKMTGSNSAVFFNNQTVYTHFKLLMTGFNRKAMFYHKVQRFSDEQIFSIRDRTLFIVGRKDPFMQGVEDSMLDKYKMNIIWYEDAGHGINHEQAEKVNQDIIDFLRPSL